MSATVKLANTFIGENYKSGDFNYYFQSKKVGTMENDTSQLFQYNVIKYL